MLGASASSADPHFAQRGFPPALELGGDKAVVGIDAVELPLGERRRVALALELSFSAARAAPCRPAAGSDGEPRQSIEFGGSQRRQERMRRRRHRRASARMCWQAGRALRGSAGDCRRIRRRACSGRTSCGRIARTRRCRGAEDHRREVRLGSYVRMYSARLSLTIARIVLIGLPVDVGGISILHDDPPLLDRPRRLSSTWRLSRAGVCACGFVRRRRRRRRPGSSGYPPLRRRSLASSADRHAGRDAAGRGRARSARA